VADTDFSSLYEVIASSPRYSQHIHIDHKELQKDRLASNDGLVEPNKL